MDKYSLLHIALQYEDEKTADVFFNIILGMDKVREFTLFEKFSEFIFNIKENVKVVTYTNSQVNFEIFITGIKPKIGYEHYCLLIEDKDRVKSECRKYGLRVIELSMNNKEYLFIKDFSGYLYEIK